MKFSYFRISLEPVTKQTLFDSKTPQKIDVLRKIFKEESKYEYTVQGRRIGFVSRRVVGDYVLAKLGRKGHVKLNSPPEKKFTSHDEEHWPVCTMLINTSSDRKKGQSIALEVNTQIFPRPVLQLERFAKKLTDKTISDGYLVVIEPITRKESFWQKVEKTQGSLQDLEFVFDAPNLFNAGDKLSEELKAVRDQFGATRTTVKLGNPEGKLTVPKDNDFVNQGVRHITKGGGQYKLRTKKRLIKSDESVEASVTEEVEVEISSDNEAQFIKACERVFQWLDSLDS